ncbi:DUF3137 domain-containing protein [Devosia sp. 63-57]|uniref:DUF3137 domain-containing protein n=1 Tax=Devosia sp. 63-57 TaxID=1895751 RepID=UPI000868D5E9|nr:DUF3137 domain-containing protein [Devosia sp. 63-57]ODT47178.1 MAG: hypothetical protein ABS74_12805 [Pelagibacterium sp. SCN 63-126]ODU88992.1 MAG: hypothetical protein ABT14_01680 [Pelagibacterium sp. SCN 63-17]OJX43111.1 MAG: hypothetical protein BGO80_17065 [Devosia sp. 63-57]
MSAAPNPTKPGWAESWASKSAVAKRLQLSSIQTRIQIAVLVFLFSPLVGFALIGFGWNNYLWILGVPLLALGLLAWVALPVVAAGAIVYMVIRTIQQGMTPAPPQPAAAMVGDLPDDPSLAPVLAELKTVRDKLAAQQKAALLQGMPIVCLIAGALAVWVVSSSSGFNPLAVALVTGLPVLLGFFLISRPFEQQFREVFKSQVLPILLQRHGTLQRRSEALTRFTPAAEMGVVARHGEVLFDDVFSGMHAGHGVEIADAILLVPRSEEDRRGPRKTQHRVLAITLDLGRSVPATTAVIDAKRNRDYFAAPGSSYERLELEDVVFASVYHVYATDQIGGRALLTPAVMRRLVEAADGHDFMPPTLLAQGNKLQLFLVTYNERDLFEPASVRTADMATHVQVIDRDLAQLFAILDTLVEVADTLATPATGFSPTDLP